MQRYEISIQQPWNTHATEHGEWVKFTDAQATIARLTAELAQSRAEAAAAYSRAAALAQAKHEVALKWASVHIPGFDGNTDSLLIANEIRALATEPGTTALAEILDAETRACAEVVRERRQGWLRPYIIARIDQRKEVGE